MSDYAPERFTFIPSSILSIINPKHNLFDSYQYKTFLQYKHQLSRLEAVSQLPGKKFIYAHIMVTHEPFVFSRSGEYQSQNYETGKGYIDQIVYINSRILKILENIIRESASPPIIILQSDHGYGPEGKKQDAFKILNAYYLPNAGGDLVYPSITPINSFRLIFSHYFNEKYPLIADQSIWIHHSFKNGNQLIPGSCFR